MKEFRKILFFGVLLLFLAVSFFLPLARARGSLQVIVSILPQEYFVERIGGGLVKVSVMVQPGASPATYEPKPRQMAALSEADIYFAIGVPFENTWLKKIASANPKLNVVHTDQFIKKIPMEQHHDHGKREHREPAIPDPHIWLSPPLVMMLARNMLEALQEADPTHRSAYEANYRAFVSELLDLDAELRDLFAQKKGLQFIVFHPSWGYFAQAYGLKQVPIEIQGKEPKPAQLQKLIAHARRNDIRVVFVQPQFSSRSARQIAREIGGQVAVADPLARNWMENLRQQAQMFRDALR